VAWTPGEKAELHAGGADIAEMESFWIGRAAVSRGIPFLAVRSVSDAHDNALIEIPDLFDEDGNVRTESVLAFTRQHPEIIPELARQHERGGRALESLGLFLEGYLPRLAGWPGRD
jgi:hypothetical protein